MPFFLAAAVSEATRPGPPPWLSMVRPPQNLNRPSTLNACRPQIGAKRTPLSRIQRSVGAALLDQHLDQLGVGAVLGDAVHVVEELVLGIGAEVGLGDLLLGEVRHQRLEVVDAVVDAAHGAGGEAAVAPGLVLRRAFEHEHGDAVLRGRQRRTQGGVASAHDHHIRRGWKHAFRSAPDRKLEGRTRGRLHESRRRTSRRVCATRPTAAAVVAVAREVRSCWACMALVRQNRRNAHVCPRHDLQGGPGAAAGAVGQDRGDGAAGQGPAGHVDAYAAWRGDGQGVVVAIYRSKEDADRAVARIQALWGDLAGLLSGAPKTDAYETAAHITA